MKSEKSVIFYLLPRARVRAIWSTSELSVVDGDRESPIPPIRPTNKPGVARPIYEDAPLRMTAQQFADQHEGMEMSKTDGCTDWLHGTLSDGPVHSDTIKRRAESYGYSASTLNRAKAKVGIESYSEPGRGYYWRLKGSGLGKGIQ